MFQESRKRVQPYTVVILKAGPRYSAPGSDRDPEVEATIIRHGKRNMRLRLAGLMPIICPIRDGTEVAGIGVFAVTPEEVERIYATDPAVKARILNYEIHPSWSFPGSALP